jgi:VanZ family protein
MSARNRALRRSLAPLAMMGLIFYVSSLPADPDVAWWEPIARTVGHIVGYAGLTLLWSWALAGTVTRPELIAAAISLTYACTDEYHQTFVENRDGTVTDVGFDAIGIALAALLVERLRASGRLVRA